MAMAVPGGSGDPGVESPLAEGRLEEASESKDPQADKGKEGK